MNMKKIIGFGLSLMISGGLIGCTTTSNNANLRGANTNTAYVVNNANVANAVNSRAANANMSNANANSKSNGNMY
jgi:hypothetical protein